MRVNRLVSWKLLEAFSVLSQLLYTWLYLQENQYCWYFAIPGSVGFAVLCFRAKIFAESLLHVFYIGMAIYGLMSVNENGWYNKPFGLDLHLLILLFSGLVTFGLGRFLSRSLSSSMPFLDSFTTVFSIAGTWLMVNYIHENWLYWIVIDAASIYLYARRGMPLAAGMFFLYFIMALVGYIQGV